MFEGAMEFLYSYSVWATHFEKKMPLKSAYHFPQLFGLFLDLEDHPI